jgi:broad specificity phosphatase PhoE
MKDQDGKSRTTILLVRHGQTEWNRVERFRGHADVPLNATGLRQAEATGRRIAAEWRPAAIYSSPLSRATKTAEAIAHPFGLLVQPVPDLIDLHFGEWQGLTPDEVSRRWPEEYARWVATPHRAHIPGGETIAELRYRAMRVVQGLVQRHAGETIVILGHTDLNRAILLGALHLGDERFDNLVQDNCAINLLLAQNGDFTVVSMNDTCHLYAPAGR